MMKFQLLVILLLFFAVTHGQGVIVNPDGTHSVITGSVIVNPNGTHSILAGSTLINPNGSTSTVASSEKKELVNSSFPAPKNTANSKFELTPAGFVNNANSSLRYILINYPGISKDELYNRAIIYYSTNFYPKKITIISNIKNESITINVLEDRIPVGEYNGKINLDYMMTLEFNDNELRILAPSINRISQYLDGQRYKILLTGSYTEKTIFTEYGGLNLVQPKHMLDLAIKNWTDKLSYILKTK